MRERYEMNNIFVAVFASAYTALTIAIAPIAFLATQVRISDALLMLAFHKKYGKEAVVGFTIGAFFANLISPLGFIDWIFGPIVNFVATLMIYLLGVFGRKYKLEIRLVLAVVSSVLASVLIAIIVAYELWLVFELPYVVGFVGVLVGELISLTIGGIALIALALRAIPEE